MVSRDIDISQCYRLDDIVVDPQQLLLDPTNPRVVLDTQGQSEFTAVELAQPHVQEYILSVIHEAGNQISELIKSISRDGFLPQGNDMIVERMAVGDKFLVLEGNRRLTAIKHIMEGTDNIAPHVRESLKRIHVKEFIYTNAKGISREQVVFKLLGLIHVSGALAWGPMEKASYIHRSYAYELAKVNYKGWQAYDVDCARRVADLLSMTVREVRKAITIYRVYTQLREGGYKGRVDAYSLIDLAVKTRQLSDEYFELDSSTLRMSPRGLGRFATLCLASESPIKNPTDFKAFTVVFKDGTDHEVGLVETGDEGAGRVADRIQRRKDEKEFETKLGDILDAINSLVVTAFRGTPHELELIKLIREAVDRRLTALAKSRGK